MRGLKPFKAGGRWTCEKSHLLQMRGLKLITVAATPLPHSRIFYRCVDWNEREYWCYIMKLVASFTDAWIETGYDNKHDLRDVIVASFTDAWIETGFTSIAGVISASHLLQMRGLKQRGLSRKEAKEKRSRIFYRCVDWNNRRFRRLVK